MYGIILRMDVERQLRVGTDMLKKLLSAKAYDKVQERRTRLNASTDFTAPFAPTLVRPSFYPDYFNATDLRTLFWKVKNIDQLHDLERVYVDSQGQVAFEFPYKPTEEIQSKLTDTLRSYGGFKFFAPKLSGSTLTYPIQHGEAGIADVGGSNG